MQKTELKNKAKLVAEKLKSMLPGLIAVYMHGSAVKSGLRADSDLDFALLFEHEKVPEAKKLFFVKPEIEEVVGRTVDFSLLSTENPVFAKEVIINGERLYCSNVNSCEQFEMYVFSLYCKLNDERKQILKSYHTQTSRHVSKMGK